MNKKMYFYRIFIYMKVKSCILVLFLCISFTTMKAQDADCPCWGEKKAFVAEVYSYGGIGIVPSHKEPVRILMIPGFSAGLKFNKRNTLMLGVNYLELKTIYNPHGIFCELPCYDCHSYKFLQPMIEWKFRTVWKTNFSSEIFSRIGVDILFYSKNYYWDTPEYSFIGTHTYFPDLSATIGYNFFFKMNKHFALNIAPFVHTKLPFSPNNMDIDSYNFIGGVKAGLKYSKYLK